MDKSSSQLGVNPLSKINPSTMVAGIGSPAHHLDEKASMFAKQQAGFMAKQAKSSVGLAAKAATSIADVSATAKLINQIVNQAEARGISHRYIAQSVITQQPKLTHIVSKQLSTAISQSGLFYESHLREFVEGHRLLASIKQEPQNQFNQSLQSLLPQQLHILEHQRLSWHGEVWPNQLMDWDVYLKKGKEGNASSAEQESNADTPVASDLTLHLPRLGKVTARISLQNGRMHIGLLTENEEALQLFKEKSPALVDAVENHGKILEGLTLAAFGEEPV